MTKVKIFIQFHKSNNISIYEELEGEKSPTLGAGDREFKSLYPDTRNPHIVKDMRIFVYRNLT